MKDFAFDTPVVVQAPVALLVRTAEQAASLIRSHLQSRFTMAGLNALLMLEGANELSECEEARLAFCRWASNEQLLLK